MSYLPGDRAILENSITTEVHAGSTAVLNCNSNDLDHNFMLWLSNKNEVIGPGTEYDEEKYKFEDISGKLHINNVSITESGFYKCVSTKLDGTGISVGEVEMIVEDSNTDKLVADSDPVKLVVIVGSIIVIIIWAVIFYTLIKERKRKAQQLNRVHDANKEDGEEINNKTTTAISQTVPGPSGNVSSKHILNMDNQGLENFQIETPHPN